METIAPAKMIDEALDRMFRGIAGDWAEIPRGVTPRRTLASFGNVTVHAFDTPGAGSGKTPLLYVPSLINRWYILDLTPDTSFVAATGEDRPCYLIDWGYPGAEAGHLPLSYYYHTAIRRAVRAIRKETGAEKVQLLGYCIGGTLAYAHACLEPESIDRLTLLAAPLDFSDMGVLGLYAERFPSEEIRSALDFMPGWLLACSFQFIQPMGTLAKTKMFRDKVGDPRFEELFLSMERWISDPVDFPIRSYYELLTDLYKGNKLAKGELMTADGRRVDPAGRTCPLLIVQAELDHIAPVPCTLPPASDVAPRQPLLLPSGHIGITTGRNGATARAGVRGFLDGNAAGADAPANEKARARA